MIRRRIYLCVGGWGGPRIADALLDLAFQLGTVVSSWFVKVS